MVNKPKAIGTAGETAVKRYAQQQGFPWAERRALHGNKDVGDLILDPVANDVIVEVKAGRAAEAASAAQVSAWMDEVDVEVGNAGVTIGFLVRKRKGAGVASIGTWHTHFFLSDLFTLRGYDFRSDADHGDPIVTMTLDDALAQVRWAGYGSTGTSPTTGVDPLS